MKRERSSTALSVCNLIFNQIKKEPTFVSHQAETLSIRNLISRWYSLSCCCFPAFRCGAWLLTEGRWWWSPRTTEYSAGRPDNKTNPCGLEEATVTECFVGSCGRPAFDSCWPVDVQQGTSYLFKKCFGHGVKVGKLTG